MCDYCDLQKYNKHSWKEYILKYIIDEFGYTELAFIYNNKTNQFSIVASGEDNVEIKIVYCPMCGRKL